jgi:hypothetical protein
LPDVFLLFLVKNDDTEAQGLLVKIPSEYRAPDIPYYLEAGKYQELKYRLSLSELAWSFIWIFYSISAGLGIGS